MKSKKFLSLLLAMVMTLALAVPAFAGDGDLTQTSEITGTTSAPTISITVPATSGVILNPYKMELKVKDGAISADGTATTTQVISPVNYIKNKTNVALNVSAVVTGKVDGSSKATFATATTQGTKAPTTKSVFMYMEVIDAGVGADADATKPTTEPTDASWKAYDAKAANQVLVAAKATTKANLLTVPAVADSKSSFIAFRLAGDAASTPTEAWTTSDTVSVTVAFTFTPTVSGT